MSMKVDLELFRIVINSLQPTFTECICSEYMSAAGYHSTYGDTLDRMLKWAQYESSEISECLSMLRILMNLKARVGPEMDACIDVASTLESLSGGSVTFHYGEITRRG